MSNGFRPAQSRQRDAKGRFVASTPAPKPPLPKKPTLRARLRRWIGRSK